jgi:hypothetical protein
MKEKLRNTWRGVIRRCTDRNSPSFRRYGAKGVTVTKRWLGPDGFATFCADVGEPATMDLTLDRKKFTEGYEPGNVQWATLEQQSRNRSTSHFVTVGDDTLTLTEWQKRTGVSRHTIRKRLLAGMPPELAVLPNPHAEEVPF